MVAEALQIDLPAGIGPAEALDAFEQEWKARRKVSAKDDLIEFTRLLFPEYQPNWHHYRIAAFLFRAMTEKGFRGIIIMPPRFGKSELASVNGPAFYMGKFPGRQIIAASHTANLAYDFSRMARNKMQDPDWPFERTHLAEDSRNVGQWEVSQEGKSRRGKYVAVGVGGKPTGKGADLLLIDDAVADAKEADSPQVRETTWQWFRQTAMTRLQPGGSAVVIGTRWHHDDLIGRILKSETSSRWEILHLPAILPNGESLWPQMWPLEELTKKRAEVGERAWQAQYMGAPTADEGSIIRRAWIEEIHAIPEGILYLLQSWDTAFKDGSGNDWSVCGTFAVTVAEMILIDLWKGQVEFPELERKCDELFARFNVREVLIEDKASGTSLIQVQRRKKGFPAIAIPVPPGESKIWRVHEITPILESRRLKVPAWASWKESYLQILTAFPLGQHDDEVDVTTQAVRRVFSTNDVPEVKSTSYLQDDDEEDRGPRWRH
jgi:predicted phage terminase large subunit-like protein